MSAIIEGLQGVLCLIDDILIFGKDNNMMRDCLLSLKEFRKLVLH